MAEPSPYAKKMIEKWRQQKKPRPRQPMTPERLAYMAKYHAQFFPRAPKKKQ